MTQKFRIFEDQGAIDIEVGRRIPMASQSSFPGRLSFGENRGSMGCPGTGQREGRGIGRGEFLKQMKRAT